jgi:hypothetical protein
MKECTEKSGRNGSFLNVLALLERTHFIPLFILIIVAFLFNAPINDSLWLDETVTFWIIKDTPIDTWFRAGTFKDHTPFYYLVLHYWSSVFGYSGVALRAFSIFCAVLSALIFGKLLLKMNLKLPVLGMSLLFVHDSLAKLWFSATPYAFAFLWTILSTYLLLNYKLNGGFFRGLLYALSGALVFYSFYPAALVLIVHFLLIRRVSIFLWVGFFSAFGVPHLVSVLLRGNILFFNSQTELVTFLSVFFPPVIMTISLIGFVMCAVIKGEKRPKLNNLGIIWWITSAAVFWLTIWYFPNDAQFYFWASPAIVILLISFFSSIKAPSLVAAVMSLLCVMVNLQRKWEIEDIRSIAEKARELKKPVLFYSGLAEHRGDPTSIDPVFLTEYLSSPLKVYGVEDVIPVNLNAIPQMQKGLADREILLVAKNDQIGRDLLKEFNCSQAEGNIFVTTCAPKLPS